MPRYARCLNTICRIRVSIVPPRCNRNVTIGSRQPKHFRSDVMADLDNNFLLCSTERPTCARLLKTYCRIIVIHKTWTLSGRELQRMSRDLIKTRDLKSNNSWTRFYFIPNFVLSIFIQNLFLRGKRDTANLQLFSNYSIDIRAQGCTWIYSINLE